GFLGGLNSAVIQRALAAREGQPAELMVLGGRGRNYFTDIGQPFTQFPGIGTHRLRARGSVAGPPRGALPAATGCQGAGRLPTAPLLHAAGGARRAAPPL